MLKPIIKTVGLVAALWSTSTLAQFPQLDSKAVAADLKQYSKNLKQNGWFAYSVPAAADTTSMCCYNKGKQAVCDLNKNQYGYGSSSQSPDTDNIHVFVHFEDGQVNRLMPIGDHCEVKAEGITVDWLTDVTSNDSIGWLKEQIVNSDEDDHHGGLYVLSLHAGKAAATALYDLASKNQGGNAEQAVFWLGQRRQDGFAYLKELYEDLPVGEVRRKINFALSQNHNTDAVDLLKDIAQHDRDGEQQADAIFWLSQTDDVADLPAFLIDLMSTANSDEVKEKAIFSLSQIDNEEANQELAKLVKDHMDAEVREKALFWLAQNSPERAQKAAIELIKTGHNESEMENAVFVLSQLPSDQSADALMKIVQGNYSRQVKKKALFWLAQSDDERVIEQLEDLL